MKISLYPRSFNHKRNKPCSFNTKRGNLKTGVQMIKAACKNRNEIISNVHVMQAQLCRFFWQPSRNANEAS